MPPSLLDHPAIGRILFHPRGVSPFEAGQTTRSLRFPVAEGVALAGRLHRAETEGAPTLLFWHGNGEIAADYDDIAAIYTRLGLNFLVVDYRGYGESDGHPTASALLADAVTVFRQMPDVLRREGLGSGPLFVMGRSLGSAAAIETAHREQPLLAGLILESAFAFTVPLITRLSGFTPQGLTEDQGFGNHRKMADLTLPILILHGEMDEIIPMSDAYALFEASPASRRKRVIIADSGHNDLMWVGQAIYFQAIADFVSSGGGQGLPPPPSTL
ncbi:MAG: alpha/beta fold hydrolase [Magnetococcales bacterium]|nr:alpha/beta fold hydrolase [Magnetococcales bacterium]